MGVSKTILDVINAEVKRSDFDANLGIFKRAEFSFKTADYKLVFSEIEHKTRIYVRKGRETDYSEIDWSWSNGKTYPVTSINGCMIYAHHLLLVCFRPELYDKFISGRFVVNHILTESHSYVCDSRYHLCERPLAEFNTDPRYLEVISYSENRQHGKYVDRLGLRGIAVSYKDSVMFYNKFENLAMTLDEILADVLSIYEARGNLDFYDKREFLFA